MSLSGDKGVAQFKKSVKMEHPIANTKSRESTLKRLWDFEEVIGDWSWCLSDMFIYANMDQNDLDKHIL